MTDAAEQEFELSGATRRVLSRKLLQAQADGRAPSAVGAVGRDGELLWWDSVSCVPGHAPGRDVQYRIGSITKTFTAVLVMRLVEEGLAGLGDAVGKHLPELPDSVADATLAQLLSHTSGLTAETPSPWWERTPGTLRPALGDVLRDPVRVHAPGDVHHYSNPGFALLGAVVERHRGVPWADAVRDGITVPLGLARTAALPSRTSAGGFAVHPWADLLMKEKVQHTGVMAPAGELWSTAGDLTRFAGFLLRGDERVLGLKSLEAMRSRASGGAPGSKDSEGYGFGLQVARRDGFGGRALFGHGGSMPGFVAGLWIDPGTGVSGVAMANATSGFASASLSVDLAREVVRSGELTGDALAEWRPMPAGDADEGLLALTGVWYWGAAPMAVRLRAGRVLELGPVGGYGRASRFRPVGEREWVGEDGYYAGEPLAVVDGRLDVGSFVFTREPYGEGAPGGVDGAGWHGL
ncbi:hypothetical protein BIV57_18960 [Mangrovactinospora gilvigrisea]|uniref:Serine hydrolase n=1 Tax=Mangrovactinospora gilvigrisea TaxID=1428644 RepID=A0A1J7C2X3_9ACTN|nr:serine hydrolase domain-containing protein [Mangrovactinospora gilvigrisea]OIV35916.1 hypothetical protein BIV57_18960 [Mangrovactinospora gilvigrisea]